jgi:hypothetical protein
MHIDVRYYFINDKNMKKEMKVVYSPTGNMAADMFTKPMQASIFKKFQIIHGETDSSSSHGCDYAAQ